MKVGETTIHEIREVLNYARTHDLYKAELVAQTPQIEPDEVRGEN